MLKHLLLTLPLLAIFTSGYSQITITANDMPVAGDTFIYSNVSVTGSTISPADSGANMVWNYQLAPTAQGMDIYQTPGEVSSLLSYTLPGNVYGYQTLDSLPFVSLALSGVTIQNLYTYFEKIDVPSAYVAAAFSLNLSGIPIGYNYTAPDVWYIFPLSYGSSDSNNYELDIDLLTYGTLKEIGYRKTRVDGWGTITTPYYTTPVNCIRVRSEVNEIDSIPVSGFSLGLPRNTVEYRWLVNGDHYPALWVTSSVFLGVETITSIQYRDKIADTVSLVKQIAKNSENITAYPNPAINGIVTINIPEDWQTFHVDVFDIQSKTVASQDNERIINLQSFPAGTYVARVSSGAKIAFVTITK